MGALSERRRNFTTEAWQRAFDVAYDGLLAQWGPGVESRRLKTPTGLTQVHSVGAGPDLVLLHGGAASATSWTPMIEGLAAQFRVHALDIMGDYGRSELAGSFASFDDAARWLGEVLDALGLERALVMGFSYGATLAAATAIRAPQRVSRLVLLSPGGVFGAMGVGFMLRGVLSLMPVRAWVDGYYHWAGAKSPEEPARYRAQFGTFLDQVWAGKRGFRPHKMLYPAKFSDADLRRLTTPTLFLIGDEEKITDPRAALERARRLAPNLQGELVAGASHDIVFSRPRAVLERAAPFLLGAHP
jgi:pimeloyl-ACP methyl ester carboxylesterase